MNECIPEVVKAMRACVKDTGASKFFSANITADDPVEMVARGKYVLSQFGLFETPRPRHKTGGFVSWPLGENCALLVVGYVAGVRLSQLRAATSRNSSCTSTVLDTVL
jgi:hypothetical protein